MCYRDSALGMKIVDVLAKQLGGGVAARPNRRASEPASR